MSRTRLETNQLRGSGALTLVESLENLPAPVAGVITLPAGASYFLTSEVNLGSNRLVAAGEVAFFGTDENTCALICTSLAPGQAVLTASSGINLRGLRIQAPTGAWCVSVDALGAPVAEGFWSAVTLTGTGSGARFKDFFRITCFDLILDQDLVTGVRLEGTFQAAEFYTCQFRGQGVGAVGVDVGAGAVFTQRFRVSDSILDMGAASTGLSVPLGVSIPSEGYLLDFVNFRSTGTPTSGITFLDDRTRWVQCRGITNTASIGQLTWTNNATATTIVTQGVYVKAEGVSTPSPLNQTFSHSNNRLTYTGGLTRTFRATAILGITGPNNNQVGILIYRDGSPLLESLQIITLSGTGRAESAVSATLTTLTTTQNLEVWVANLSAIANITVESLNFLTQNV